MGIGDDIIATGLARGAAARGKRIAFGDGRQIKWGPHSKMMFKSNPNVAPPGSERDWDVEWINYYKGSRIYNSGGSGRWVWNYKFKVRPGEIFFDPEEEWSGVPDDLILIEPNVPAKPNAPNKQWPADSFAKVVEALSSRWTVRQFDYGGRHSICPGIRTETFRKAAGLLKRARAALLPEGGLHHAAAAVDVPAVVLFGGFAPPAVLGYAVHANLVGSDQACGSYSRCDHCLEAMRKISPDQVAAEVERLAWR